MQFEVFGRLPTIPEYFRIYINQNVDLTMEPKQCCPFHHEDTPSFSYSGEKRRWRCFGACKVGGDVIDMHMKNRGFKSREEAEDSLRVLHKAPKLRKLELSNLSLEVNTMRVEDEAVLQTAYVLANCPERWIELDYIMSQYPPDVSSIQNLINKWKGGALHD